ncbi:hypothetical protein AYJ58_13190 [Shewanella sp. Pdp11]|uniref:hypothetical protein n=1 Tax=Shewanella sp. Pdp11 TaxID=2059264 RepID=UPI000CA32EAF|nr:hypothetical protein [Shewanella sp. Pdp11]AUD60379.1 hypothetical protein AYJ58_13190 [Shewanella sp. Pdp11]
MPKITDKFTSTIDLNKNIKDLISPVRSPVKPELFKERMRNLVEQTLTELNAIATERQRIIKLLESPHNSLSNHYNPLHDDYSFALTRYDQITDLIRQSDLAETRAHRRNLFYRTLTTLAVGLSIMAIYALAHWLEIPMPLMRLPVPS